MLSYQSRKLFFLFIFRHFWNKCSTFNFNFQYQHELNFSYFSFSFFYRNVSSPNKTLTRYYTWFTKATSRSVSAKTAASVGTSYSTTSSVTTQALSTRFCREVWAGIIPFTRMEESKDSVREGFRQDRFESDCRWRIVKHLRALRYRTMYNCTSVMETYSYKKFRQRNKILLTLSLP